MALKKHARSILFYSVMWRHRFSLIFKCLPFCHYKIYRRKNADSVFI